MAEKKIKVDEANKISPPTMRPDEATIAFWRLRRNIMALPIDVRLQILFWWLLDHLHLFEYCEDVSTSSRVLVVFSFDVFF